MPDQLDIDTQAVREALEVYEKASREPRQLTLSNGIVLEIRRIPAQMMRRALQVVKRPEVPTVDLGDGATEENPDDPDYQAALEAFHTRRMEVITEVLKTAGTKLVSVPEGMEGPGGDEWLEQARAIGLEPDVTSPLKRYREWLDLYALEAQSDTISLTALTMMRFGLLEQEVLETMAWFRSRAQRGIDPLSLGEEPVEDEHSVQAPDTGDGAGARGA